MADGENFRSPPGSIRDALLSSFIELGPVLSVSEVEAAVDDLLGSVPSSSIRSFLANNSPALFQRVGRGRYALGEQPAADRRAYPEKKLGRARLVRADCIEWLKAAERQSIHAVITDPPYGLIEYDPQQIEKKNSGRGGVWRVPPSFDCSARSPLPRFTVLRDQEVKDLIEFFVEFGRALRPVLVPGANVLVASNPLLFHHVTTALQIAGLEPRGTLVRLVMTMRGGDRPKNAHAEFKDVSVMPRSMWEPWVMMRAPIEGRVQDNLRNWSTGGFRRPSDEKPYGDVVASRPTSAAEKKLAPHHSLKPQDLLSQLVRAALPLNKGVILDPFAGSGSLLAAANVVGRQSIGIERDAKSFE